MSPATTDAVRRRLAGAALLVSLGGCGSEITGAPPAIGRNDAGIETGDNGSPSEEACRLPCTGSRCECAAMVPMRDGVLLHTRWLLPEAAAGPVSTVFLRTPYWRLESPVFEFLSRFSELGYAFAYQTVRGVGRSGGRLRPVTQEFSDGQDAIAWIAAQPWSNGRIATMGGSYEGMTALYAAVGSPEVKLVIADGYLIHAFESFPASHQGALSWNLLWWSHLARTGEDLQQDVARTSLGIATNHRPISDLDVALFGARDTLWREVAPDLERRTRSWDRWEIGDRMSELCAPVLHFQAATEFEDDVLDTFLAARTGACPQVRAQQHYILGAHAHTGAAYAPFDESQTGRLIRRALAATLDGRGDFEGVPPVQYYLQNAAAWGSSVAWPPHARQEVLYLEPGPDFDEPSRLSVAPSTTAGELSYTFDPATEDACSDRGQEGYAWFESAPLDHTVDMVGPAQLAVRVSIDTPDADLFAYLEEVLPGGEAQLVTLAALRLRFRESMESPSEIVPGTAVLAKLDFTTVGYRFRAGSRIRLWVTSTECGLTENANTGGSMVDATETRAVRVTLHGDRDSKLILPAL